MKLSSLVLPLFLLAGCAASEAPDASLASEVVAAPRPDSQHFDRTSKADADATFASFASKNPEFQIETASAQVNDLTGGIKQVRNEAPLGPRVTLTASEAVTKASAFVKKNAVELALTDEDISAATVQAKPYPFESGTYPWTVTFNHVTTTPGYASFDEMDRFIAVSVDFSKDGTVGNVYSATNYYPGLRVSTTPALGANSPELVQNVIGTELVWHDPSFVPGPDQNVGRITKFDISTKIPIMHVSYDEAGVNVTLAYRILVRRGGHYWTFMVHNRTGAVLDSEQVYDF